MCGQLTRGWWPNFWCFLKLTGQVRRCAPRVKQAVTWGGESPAAQSPVQPHPFINQAAAARVDKLFKNHCTRAVWCSSWGTSRPPQLTLLDLSVSGLSSTHKCMIMKLTEITFCPQIQNLAKCHDPNLLNSKCFQHCMWNCILNHHHPKWNINSLTNVKVN